MTNWFHLIAPAWLLLSLLMCLSAPLGCLMVWQRLSFFAEALAHGALLGVGIAALLHLPLSLGVALTAASLVAALWFLHDNRIPTDALLAMIASGLLCGGLLMLSAIPSERSRVTGYLFGDVLLSTPADLAMVALAVCVGCALLYKNWQAQIKLAVDVTLAASEGISTHWQRLLVMSLMALFTVVAIKAIGAFLIGALLVVPALTARLLARSPTHMVMLALIAGLVSVALGLWLSVWCDTASGATIVLTMIAGFFMVKFFRYITARLQP